MFKSFIMVLSIFLSTPLLADEPPLKTPNANATSRFIVRSDGAMEIVAGFSLPKTWWSRPYEYAWAFQFAGPDLVVLDAACGVSHPFKWLLGQTCKET